MRCANRSVSIMLSEVTRGPVVRAKVHQPDYTQFFSLSKIPPKTIPLFIFSFSLFLWFDSNYTPLCSNSFHFLIIQLSPPPPYTNKGWDQMSSACCLSSLRRFHRSHRIL